MKPQDIVLLIILLIFFFLRKPRWVAASALILFALSIPLFAKWIFFTAQHFVWWGVLYILIASLWLFFEKNRD